MRSNLLKQQTCDAIDEAMLSLTEFPELKGVPTGFRDLDYVLGGGLKNEDVTVVGARPSMGKTAFALSIVEKVAVRDGNACIYFSLEGRSHYIYQRLLRMIGRIKHSNPRHMNEDEKVAIAKAAEYLKAAPVYVVDATCPTVDMLLEKSKEYKDCNIRFIAIDSLDLITAADFPENPLDMHHIMLGLKVLAREMNCPVLILSQISRAPENRENHRPFLTDFRNFREVVDFADNIFFLYRDDYYIRNTERAGICEVVVSKQKNGPLGTVEIRFETDYMRFVDMERYAWDARAGKETSPCDGAEEEEEEEDVPF